MNNRDYYFVAWNGQGFWNGGNRHYFITRFDGVVDSNYLVHDQIDNNIITLGSWYGIQERILAIRNAQTPPSQQQQISLRTDKTVYNQGESPTIFYSLDKKYWASGVELTFPDGSMNSGSQLTSDPGPHQWQPCGSSAGCHLTSQLGQHKLDLIVFNDLLGSSRTLVATTYYTVVAPQPTQPTYCCGTNCPPGSICDMPPASGGTVLPPASGGFVQNATPIYL
jgi:hypothetical protein